MRRGWFFIAVVVVGLTGFAAWAYAGDGDGETLSPVTARLQGKTSLAPLTIEAMRSRTYSARDFVVARELSTANGRHDQVVSYQSDGLRIYALLSTPTTPAPSAGWPVVIIDHGYVNPARYHTDGPEYRDFIAGLTKAGFMVVKPDYRGNGSSEGSPAGGYFSPGYTYDTLNLIAALKRHNGVDRHRIGLLGHSMGAHVVLNTLVISPDIRASSLLAGVVGTMDDMFYHWPHPPSREQPVAAAEEAQDDLIDTYGEPRDDPAFWNQVSAINYVKAIAGPVQVIHSTADASVPRVFSDHLVAALRAVDKPVEYQVYPGNDHQLARSRTAVVAQVVDFFRTHLYSQPTQAGPDVEAVR